MDNTFSELMGFYASDKYSNLFQECQQGFGRFVTRKVMPVTLAGCIFGQVGQVIEYEKEFRGKLFSQIVKEHQSGEKDHSIPEPDGFQGMVVGLTTTNTTASTNFLMASGDQTQKIQWNHTLIQIQKEDGDTIGFHTICEAINPSRITKI